MAKDEFKLTEWGNFVARHTVMTPPKFWTDLVKEVERAADAGADYGVLLDERIAGLMEFRARRRINGAVTLWRKETRGAAKT